MQTLAARLLDLDFCNVIFAESICVVQKSMWQIFKLDHFLVPKPIKFKNVIRFAKTRHISAFMEIHLWKFMF